MRLGLGLLAVLLSGLLAGGCGQNEAGSSFVGDPRIVGLWVPAEPDASRGLPADAFLLLSDDGTLEQFTGREGLLGTYRVDGAILEFSLGAEHGSVRFGWALDGSMLTLRRTADWKSWRGAFKRAAKPGSLEQARTELGARLPRFVTALESRAREAAETHAPGIQVDVRSSLETELGRALSLAAIELSAMEHDGKRHPVHLRCTLVRRGDAWTLVHVRQGMGTEPDLAWRILLEPDGMGRVILHEDASPFTRMVREAWAEARRTK